MRYLHIFWQNFQPAFDRSFRVWARILIGIAVLLSVFEADPNRSLSLLTFAVVLVIAVRQK